MNEVISWLVRYGHVLGAAVWTGGYAALALVIVPLMEKSPSETIGRLAVTTVRVGTYAGTLVIGFGVVLIARTNGYSHLLGTAWGTLVLASAVTAVVLFGIGDGALRPALLRLAAGGDGRAARRWSLTGLVLTVLAIGMMTGATYVG